MYLTLLCLLLFIWKMGAIMGPVSVVEEVKYDDCVKALNSAPVGVGGQMWVSFYAFAFTLG